MNKQQYEQMLVGLLTTSVELLKQDQQLDSDDDRFATDVRALLPSWSAGLDFQISEHPSPAELQTTLEAVAAQVTDVHLAEFGKLLAAAAGINIWLLGELAHASGEPIDDLVKKIGLRFAQSSDED